MYRSATAAIVKLTEKGPWMLAIAILKDPGVSDVKHFVLCQDGTICQEVWDYRLTQYRGCFTITSEVFDNPRED